MRAALYARFSSDLQNAASIADQLRACRRHAERIGATVAEDAVFTDAAISGASMGNRPGLAALLAAAQAGAFDVVVAEAMDRLTRSGGDAWDLFYDLEAAGVRISTISEGDVGELAIGFKGTMNALFLRELRLKVKRGHEGVLRDGRHVGAHPYGYRPRLAHDTKGERIKGLLEIDPDQAAVVRRVAAEYLAGSTGHAIAHRLNAEGLAGPGGRPWTYSAIIGRPGEIRGILRNPIYAGELVLNRQSKKKDRRTGKSRTVPNPPAEWLRQPVEALRILDAATWTALQARLDARSAQVKAAGNPSAVNAPRRLLAGLVRCGSCGGPMNTTGPTRGYRCVTRMRQGPQACVNARYAPAGRLEDQVLRWLREDLLHPDVVEAFVREYHAARAAGRQDGRARRAGLERELQEARRRAARLVDQVADGILAGPTVAARLAELEARAAQLAGELAAIEASAEVVALHPQAATRYRQLVDRLQTTLAEPGADLDAARAALRQLVRKVEVHPLEGRGQWRMAVDADLTALLGLPRDVAPAIAAAN